MLSRYDGTIDGPDPDPASAAARGPDPVLDRAVPVWTSAFVGYAREELGYDTDVTYRLLNPELAGSWDYGTTPNRQGYAGALDELQAARAVLPSLGVLIAHGRTDLVTPYFASRYLVDQLPTAGRRRADRARGLRGRAHDVHRPGLAPRPGAGRGAALRASPRRRDSRRIRRVTGRPG